MMRIYYLLILQQIQQEAGSTYSQNFNDADNATLNCYNALKIYLEE